MTITRPVPPSEQTAEAAVDAFISGAPDAPKKPRGVIKGNRRQITLTMTQELIDRVDAMARELGQSRATIVNLAVHRAVEHGLSFDGLPRKN